MELERTISEKGQVVIPKDVRKKLGLAAGSEIIFEVKDGQIIIKKKMSPKDFVDYFTDVPKKIKGLTIKKIKSLMEEQYEIH